MSDFDTVLERLVTDPTFQARLTANPDAALAGYTLDSEERALLGVPVSAGEGADRTVELRTSKSGVVGMLGPVVSALGVAAASVGVGPASEGTATLGSAPLAGSGHAGGAVPPLGDQSLGSAGTQSLGGDNHAASMGTAPVPATDYHTRVDVDGDGHWDAYHAFERADGGVDIEVDLDRDGRVDFVGHDYDRDALVDDADFDEDHDGVLDTRMYDDTGDGWMDRRTPIPRGPGQTQETFGPAPGSE